MDPDLLSRNNTELILNDVPDVLINLGVMAAKIAYNNFEWRYVTLILFNSMPIFTMQSFFVNYRHAVLIRITQDGRRDHGNIRQYVIFGHTSEDIIRIILWLDEFKYASEGKFLIICSSLNVIQCNKQQVFNTLSGLKIPNIVFLKAANSIEPEAYSYKIMKPGKCYNNEPERLQLMLNCENDLCFTNLYPEKLKNFHLCPIVVSTLEEAPYIVYVKKTQLSGFDGYLLRVVANILNATLIIKTPNELEWGRFVNNTWTGAFGDLINGRADASISTSPLTTLIHGHFQVSSVYFYTDIIWAAKLPTRAAAWEKLLHPLSSCLWISLLCLFIIIAVINIYLRKRIWKKEFSHHCILLYSCLIFFGMPLHKFPSKPTYLILIYSWVWFCFIIRCAYQAALFNSLNFPAYRYFLKTVDDVLQFPYGGPTNLREYYHTEPHIYDNWIVLDYLDTYRVLDEILHGTSDFIIAGKQHTILNHIKNSSGTKMLQILPQIVVRTPSVIYFKKGSPFSTPINRILRSISETGFIHFAQHKYLEPLNEEFKVFHVGHYARALNTEYFKGVFYVLGWGWLLSLINFAIEVLLGILLRNRNK